MNSVLALSYSSDGDPTKWKTEAENEKSPVANCRHVDVKGMNHFHWSFKERFHRNVSGKFRALSAGKWTILCVFLEEKEYSLVIEGISLSLRTLNGSSCHFALCLKIFKIPVFWAMIWISGSTTHELDNLFFPIKLDNFVLFHQPVLVWLRWWVCVSGTGLMPTHPQVPLKLSFYTVILSEFPPEIVTAVVCT